MEEICTSPPLPPRARTVKRMTFMELSFENMLAQLPALFLGTCAEPLHGNLHRRASTAYRVSSASWVKRPKTERSSWIPGLTSASVEFTLRDNPAALQPAEPATTESHRGDLRMLRRICS